MMINLYVRVQRKTNEDVRNRGEIYHFLNGNVRYQGVRTLPLRSVGHGKGTEHENTTALF